MATWPVASELSGDNKNMWNWKKGVLVRVAGEGGEGVISCGDMIGLAMVRAGLDIFTFRTFPAEIRGGPAMNQVRAVDGVALSQGDALDVLIAFNADGCRLHLKDLREGGILVYDPDDCEDDPARDIIRLPIPLNKIATELKSKLSKNVVALGVAGRVLGFPIHTLEAVVRERFGRKSEDVVAKNVEALHAGFERIDISSITPPQELSETPINDQRVVMSGNESIALGAIAAGMTYYGGYPITPASEIMESLAVLLPKFGGTSLQSEDEISALASVIGASYAGAKAMTATSGPGLALMAELIGYASMAEIPCVIVDVQRGGPSTGLPTKTEQSDLDFAVYGGHGEAPRIVLAPGSVHGCFVTTVQAFNLAEKYQCPVIVLSDQALASRTQEFKRPDLSKLEIIDRIKPAPDDLIDYKRYANSATGISPMAVPGIPGGQYIATGLEHGENALPNYTGAVHMEMLAKRWRKIQPAVDEKDATIRHGAKKGKVGIIGWGSTEGVFRDTLSLLRADGYECGYLQVRMLSPLPEAQIADFINDMDNIIVPEINFSGQLARMLRAAFLRPFIQYNKATGLPFTTGDIYNVVVEVYKNGKDYSGLQIGREANMVPWMR